MTVRRPPPGTWLEAVLATTAFLVASIVLMWPVLAHPAERVYGLPSDPLSEVWRLEQFRSGEIELVGDDTTHMANVPSGFDMRRPIDVSQALYDVLAATLARLLEPVLAYNLLVLLALTTSGIAMYGVTRALGARPLGAATAGTLFVVAPAHMVEAQLHVALSFTAPLPLLLLLGVRALQRPSAWRGAAFGAAVAVCGYVNAYLLLEAGVVALAVALAAAVLAVRGARVEPLGAAVGAGLLAALVVGTPLLAVLAVFKREIDIAVARSPAEAAAYSLRLREYVDRDLPPYIGGVALALAIAALVLRAGPSLVRLSASLVAVLGVVVSLRGVMLAGIDVPMPSDALHDLVPYWRVFGRVAVVATLGVAVLAAFALDRLAARRPLGVVLAAVLALAAVADVVREPPPAGADLGQEDPVAEALARGGGPVAEYPLFGFDNDRLGPYLFRQLRHRRPLLNGGVSGTASGDLAAAAAGLGSAQAQAALTLAGVRAVVVDAPASGPRVRWLRPLGRFGEQAVYEVEPLAGDVAVAATRGGYPAEPGPDGSSFAWLGDRPKLAVVASRPGPVEASFWAVSHGVPRRARIGPHTLTVGTTPTEIRLCLRAGDGGAASEVIETMPPAASLPGGDTRVAGLGVWDLSARPGCDVRP